MKYYNGARRIYPWRRMHRSRAPSIAPGTFFVAQSWAGCITNMPGFNLRQAQGQPPVYRRRLRHREGILSLEAGRSRDIARAFVVSTEGGVDIEKVAHDAPDK